MPDDPEIFRLQRDVIELRNTVAVLTKQLRDVWPPRRYDDDQVATSDGFFARIGVSTRDGTNWRWSYAFVEMEKSSSGFAGWTAKTGGRSGAAYNSIETINFTGGSQWGNGVRESNLSGTALTIQPAPETLIVRMYEVTRTDGNLEYWFSYENGIDGSCA